jgi:ABC-type nitrate/sulfonate/bicarbonate transport system permease component
VASYLRRALGVELASPVAVIDAGRQLWAQGALQSALGVSLERVVAGLAVGIFTGLFCIGTAAVIAPPPRSPPRDHGEWVVDHKRVWSTTHSP